MQEYISELPRPLEGRADKARLWLIGIILTALLIMSARALPMARAFGDTGYRDFSFGYTQAPFGEPNNSPTGEKPQSKLWFNDGSWWGVLYNRAAGVAGEYHIYQLSWQSQTWSDTGTLVDARFFSHADALWDGSHLYVATASQPASGNADDNARVLRFSYSSSTHSYSLDTGFPVVVYTSSVEAIVIDKDTTGLLWLTFTHDNGQGGRNVYVTHTTADDLSWITPHVLPATGANNLAYDDISAVVAYRSQIGVMWSNQNDSTMYFASHADGTADNVWVQNPALQGPSYADDHINLKSLQADASGQVFAAVKTSLNDLPKTNPGSPLILLLVLGQNGSWSRNTFGTVQDNHTRPIVLIDDEHRHLYMFAASNVGNPPSAIYYKKTSLDNITFPSGLGTPFIQSSTDTNINNSTSTRSSVDGQSSIVVLASDLTTGNYWHNTIDLSSPTTATPAATATSTPTPTATPRPTYTTLVLADLPVAYWRLGDSSGTIAIDGVAGNNGAIRGGVTLGVPGALVGDPNTAMKFNGTSGNIQVANRGNLNMTGDFTIELWAQPAQLDGTSPTLLAKGGSTIQYRLGMENNHWKGTVFIGGQPVSLIDPGTTTTTAWTYLVLARSGGTLSLYVNGINVGTATASGKLDTTKNLLAIGRDAANSSGYFSGTIDEVAVYNKALAPSRILSHYNAGAGR